MEAKHRLLQQTSAAADAGGRWRTDCATGNSRLAQVVRGSKGGDGALLCTCNLVEHKTRTSGLHFCRAKPNFQGVERSAVSGCWSWTNRNTDMIKMGSFFWPSALSHRSICCAQVSSICPVSCSYPFLRQRQSPAVHLQSGNCGSR